MKQLPHFLEFGAFIIDSMNEWIGRFVAWLTLGMVLVTVIVVILRYGFNEGSIAMQESITYMHALAFMLGMAYTLKHDGHVRVDVFYRVFSPRGKAWVNLFGSLFLLMPMCALILWMSWTYVLNSWSVFEGSREPGGIPAVFLLKTTIIVTSIMLILQGVSQAIHSLLLLIRYERSEHEHRDEIAEKTTIYRQNLQE